LTEPDRDASTSEAEPGPAQVVGPPGSGTFTIEGRRAPGLFVVGWLASLLGAGLTAVGVLASSGATAVWLVGIGVALLSIGLVAGAGSQTIERMAKAGDAGSGSTDGLPSGGAATTGGYFGPSPVLVFGAVISLTLLLGLVLSVPLELAGLDPESPAATFIGLLVTAAIYVGLIRLLVVGTGGLSWSAMGVRRPDGPAVAQLLYGAALGLPLLFATGVLALALSQVLAPSPSPLPDSADVLGGLLNLASAAVIAPIAEEIFFRGFATTAWLRALGERTAIVRGALFFAAAHVIPLVAGAPDVGQVAFAFVVRLPVALALGWVFVRRRSLYAAIGLHAVFNGLPVIVVLLGGGTGA
jgi:membrane protease YdiL (CAAX protease family)